MFSDNIVSYAKGERIIWNNQVVKDGHILFLPFVHKAKQYIAYSKTGDCRVWNIFENNIAKAKIYQITENGNEFVKTVNISHSQIELSIPPKTALLIKFE